MSGFSARVRDETLEAAAAMWFARMRSDRRTVQDEDAFSRWLAEAPEHGEAYDAMRTLWAGLEAYAGDPAVLALRSQALAESRRRRSRGRWPPALNLFVPGLLAACCVFAVLVGFGSLQEARYGTGLGERRTIRLDDGSEVTLNTDTAIRVRYRLWSRRVELESGEAHFKISHNALRPFWVEAGDGLIRDLGTEFEVYRQPNAIQVTLIEGKVDVRSRRDAEAGSLRAEATELSAGEQVSVLDHGLSPVTQANIPKATAWLRGSLVFDAERLADALAEVNRYSGVKLQLADPRLAELRINGVFHTGSTQSFLNALHESFAIEAAPAPGGIMLLKKVASPVS